MSSKFANRRKPRKVGGDDSGEEDSGLAPGMSTMLKWIACEHNLTRNQNANWKVYRTCGQTASQVKGETQI